MSDSPASSGAPLSAPEQQTAGVIAARPGEASVLHPEADGGIRARILAVIDRPLVGGFAATLGVLGALLLGSALISISTILVYIVLALFLSLGLDPIVRLLERHGVKRGAGIGIVFGAFALLMAAFLVFVLPPVIAQIGQFVRAIPEALDEIPQTEWFVALPPDWQVGLGVAIDQLAATLSDPAFLAALGGGVLSVGIGVVSAISGGFIVVALTLYFLASLTAMKEALYSLAPARSRPKLADMTERITASVGSALIGSVTLSSLNALVVFVLHIVLDLPFPALMAVVAFVITLIPLFGSVIFWILASVIALFSSPQQALIFFIAYLVYIQIESYVVSPRVMNRAISIPAALVLIAAMVGGTLMGVLGVLVALPVTASILLIIREVVVPKQDLKT
ncbi:AI-2E family transporter [Microbacterium sp. BK668]|uniref:AI-2E family transporter n=1 Tax=Microbacterium sp. BK668 TaxID=2512118 RepID=UPI00105C619B|nr:AI-2E family transporter [Microbacterium sp. BK668]TDN91175.1 putative PurR-regulated permease PerM [Microbacterium sp. BK668]